MNDETKTNGAAQIRREPDINPELVHAELERACKVVSAAIPEGWPFILILSPPRSPLQILGSNVPDSRVHVAILNSMLEAIAAPAPGTNSEGAPAS